MRHTLGPDMPRREQPVSRRTSYKSLLASIMPLAVATNDEQRKLIADATAQLGAAEANARARGAAYYEANSEKCKARAKAQRRTPLEKRRTRYARSVEHYRAKGREYAQQRRDTGKAAQYAEILKTDGRNRAYQAKYKYGDFGEAALALTDLELELTAKGKPNV